MIVHEAAETFLAVYHALIAWLIVLAVFASMVAGAAVARFAPGARAPGRGTAPPSWRRGRLGARIHARTRVRAPRRRSAARVPSWATQQPIDHYEEAA